MQVEFKDLYSEVQSAILNSIAVVTSNEALPYSTVIAKLMAKTAARYFPALGFQMKSSLSQQSTCNGRLKIILEIQKDCHKRRHHHVPDNTS